jgi:hypothetical protein
MSVNLKESGMTRSIASIRLACVLALSLAVAGCAGAPASAIPSADRSGPPPTATPLPLATPSELPPETTPTAAPSAPSMSEPPAATIAAEGGDPVAGSLGTFTWGDGGSDSPWLPGAPIEVGTGETLTLAFAGGTPVRDWIAKRVAAGALESGRAISLGHGDGEPVAFAAPAPGAWSVQVNVTFGDDLGSATYYWAVTVR